MKRETEPFAWGLISSLYYLLFIAVFTQLSCRTPTQYTAGGLRASTTSAFAAEVHAVCSNRTKGNGSGVLVGGEFVMTAWHVIDCGEGGKVLHVTVKIGAETFIGDVVREWRSRDIAKLRVYGLPPRPVVTIASIADGDRLCSASTYPYTRSVCGPVYTIYDTVCPKLEWCHNANYLGDGPVIPGNSGSGVYNAKGALVGLVTGGTPVGFPNPIASMTRLWELREDLQ